jgi:hypothetical protein
MTEKLTRIYGDNYIGNQVTLEANTFIVKRDELQQALGVPFEIIGTSNFINDNGEEITLTEDGMSLRDMIYVELGTLQSALKKHKAKLNTIHSELLHQLGAGKQTKLGENPFSFCKQVNDSAKYFVENGTVYPYTINELLTAILLLDANKKASQNDVACDDNVVKIAVSDAKLLSGRKTSFTKVTLQTKF